MHKLTLKIEEISKDGAHYLLQRLYGLPPGSLDNWLEIGPLIESHKIDLSYLESDESWDASILGIDGLEYITAINPRLAVARLLLKMAILRNPESSHALRMPMKEALKFYVRSNLSADINLIIAKNKGESPSEVVELLLEA